MEGVKGGLSSLHLISGWVGWHLERRTRTLCSVSREGQENGLKQLTHISRKHLLRTSLDPITGDRGSSAQKSNLCLSLRLTLYRPGAPSSWWKGMEDLPAFFLFFLELSYLRKWLLSPFLPHTEPDCWLASQWDG